MKKILSILSPKVRSYLLKILLFLSICLFFQCLFVRPAMSADVHGSTLEGIIDSYRSFVVTVAAFFLGIITLITYFVYRRRKVDIKVKMSEERFRHIADSSGDWIWETDKNGRYTYSSRGVRNVLGYEPEEIVGKRYFYDFCFSQDKSKLKQKAAEQIAKKQLFIHEVDRRQHKDGHEVILDIKGFALKSPKGKIIGYRGIDRDVTERKYTENTIKKERNFVSAILDIIGAPVIVLDMEGHIIRFNRTCEWITGYTFDEVNGKHIWDFLLVSEEVEKVKSRFKDLNEKEHSNRGENYWLTKDGQRRLILWSNTTLVNEYIISTGIDITEQREAEIQVQRNRIALEQVNKDLAVNEKLLREMVKDLKKTNEELKGTQDQLIQSQKVASIGVAASGIAHEIKNPLAIITLSMERVEKILAKTGNDGKKYFDRIRNATERADRVINSLLMFSRESELKMSPLNIHETIDAAIILVEKKAELSKVTIQREYTRNIRLIDGDNVMLQQVFFDLLTNAIDAMPKGGEVIIETKLKTSKKTDEGEYVIAKIRDTGMGVNEDVRLKMFDPFFTTKEPGVGTGLGLSIVYLILERHDGVITVDSKVGAGTTFTIKLPLSKALKED